VRKSLIFSGRQMSLACTAFRGWYSDYRWVGTVPAMVKSNSACRGLDCHMSGVLEDFGCAGTIGDVQCPPTLSRKVMIQRGEAKELHRVRRERQPLNRKLWYGDRCGICKSFGLKNVIPSSLKSVVSSGTSLNMHLCLSRAFAHLQSCGQIALDKTGSEKRRLLQTLSISPCWPEICHSYIPYIDVLELRCWSCGCGEERLWVVDI
jgi:hypothetical protein